MGKRGPASKPTELRVLQGNPSNRKLNNKEPTFDNYSEIPKPPSTLSRYAKTEWKRIVPILYETGILKQTDEKALAAYCQCYHRWVESEKLIRTYGYTYVTDKGNIVQRPEVGIANTALKEMVKIGKEFGLTPSSRSGIHVEHPEKTEDPFMEFIKGGKNG